jgi:hypothetical protein
MSEDHEQLRALGQRYARAVDERDFDAIAALFTPDAQIDGLRGSTPVSVWIENLRGPRSFATSMHLLGEPLISLGPGADVATLDTYAVVYQIRPEGSVEADLTLGMRYLDDVVRVEARWLIRRRASKMIWAK